MRVLVVNAGSSSLKTAIIEEGRTVARSTVDRWDASAPLDGVAELLSKAGGVGDRVVHGGADHNQSRRIDRRGSR